MSNSVQMRKFMALTEAKAMDYTGPHADNPNIQYSAEGSKGEITKVIASLSSYDSGKYTKMGRNLNRIKWLADKIDVLKEQVKQETRGAIADLFHAEDACRTRVIDTVGFVFTMTKDPAPSNSVQYAKVLEELEGHLTPELVAVMEGIKAKYTKIVEKEPALIKALDKSKQTSESRGLPINEGVLDSLKAFAHGFLQKVLNWGKSYDAKLDALKKEVGGVSEAIVDEGEIDEARGDPAMDCLTRLIDAALDLGKAYGSRAERSEVDSLAAKLRNAKNEMTGFMTDD